jgi:hypothetical protein
MSAAPAAATVARRCSLVGEMMSKVAPSAASRHVPAMKSCVGVRGRSGPAMTPIP